MKKVHKQIFRDLYESVNGLYAFTFYSRYKITPSLLFQFVETYEKEKLISFSDGKINLTDEGKLEAVKFVRSSFSSKNKFENIPCEFLDYKLKINSLYLPNVESFNSIKKQKGGIETSI